MSETRSERNASHVGRLVSTYSMLAIFWIALTGKTGRAADSADLEPRPALKNALGPLIAAHCATCHDGDRAEAGLNLVDLASSDSVWPNRSRWQRVRERIAAGEMPPADADSLPGEARASAIAWLDAELADPPCDGSIHPGRPTLRRLNRIEYANTIRDLTGVDFPASTAFPNDDLAFGFDNNGDALALPPVLLEKYLSAAAQIAEQAIAAPEDATDPSHVFPAEKLQGGDGLEANDAGPDAVALYTNGEVSAHVEISSPGIYVLRAHVYASRCGDALARMELRAGSKSLRTFSIAAEQDDPDAMSAYFFGEPSMVKIAGAFLNDAFEPDADESSGKDRNLYIQSLEVMGPVDERMASTDSQTDVVVGLKWSDEAWNDDAGWRSPLEKGLRDLLARAYRRPADDEEVGRLLEFVAASRRRGDSWQRAWQLVLRAVLASPNFLFRQEAAREAEGVRPLDDYELASRLSYFLWSTMPDRPLREAAAQGVLRRDLELHVTRMLADPRSDELIRHFGEQWLETRKLLSLTPDRTLFPEFDEPLRNALREEAFLVLREVRRRGLPLATLLSADFTFANARLAEHYGLKLSETPDPSGEANAPSSPKGPQEPHEFRRVSLPTYRQGGVLTLGAVLSVTSHVDNPSPVLRGKWILERLLNDAPPAPPPGVATLPPPDPKAPRPATFRERLAAHVADPSCAACHQRIDPLGLALEHFDALGRWRDRDASGPIDARAKLVDGSDIEGALELRDALLGDFATFRRALAEQMLVYALGRGLEYDDHCAVQAVVSATQNGGDTLDALIRAIIVSDPFLYLSEESP